MASQLWIKKNAEVSFLNILHMVGNKIISYLNPFEPKRSQVLVRLLHEKKLKKLVMWIVAKIHICIGL